MTALAQSVFEFSAADLDGQSQALAQWRGKVLLIVNTASACGFTPQYAGLQALQERYGPQGFTVLAFPCNQFGAQEPGSAEEIAQFCISRYATTFPLFAKVEVNGEHAHPLWRWLTREASGLLGSHAIKWNFTKFLVGRDGQVLKRYAPQEKPELIGPDIEMALQAAA
ncbi:MAG: glutathione peroxidase [Burkholderiaceae bacterium]|nr:glutathione peroxidase [Burkholderiaceae bacterium]